MMLTRANTAAVFILAVGVVISSGLAFAVRTRADAHAPASVNNFGKAATLGNPPVAPNDEVVAIASPKKAAGYWVVSKRGQVYPFGNVASFGGIPADVVNNITDIASTPSGKGYWLMATNGNVYTYGDALFLGTPELDGIVGRTFVTLLPSKSGKGYTLVDNTGAVETYGDASSYGTPSGQLNGDVIVDAQATPSGKGYVMLSTKGAVYAFGDATFYGAAAAGQLIDDATAIAYTDGARGYWILAADGGIFTFGDAGFHGTAVEPKNAGAPSVDLAVHSSGDGYWIVNGKTRQKPVRNANTAQAAAKTAAALAGVVAPVASNDNAEIWARLRDCESHGNYSTNTGNGYYGAYQFSAGTWRSMNTGYERADLAPPEVQDDAARRLQARSGWGQWPVCSRNAGAR